MPTEQPARYPKGVSPMCTNPEQYVIVDQLKRLAVDEAKALVEFLELDLSVHTMEMEKQELRKFTTNTEALDMQILARMDARAQQKTVLDAARAAVASKLEELRVFKESRVVIFVGEPMSIPDILATYLIDNPDLGSEQPWDGTLN